MDGYRGKDGRANKISDQQFDALVERTALRAVELLSNNDEFVMRCSNRTLGKIKEQIGDGVVSRVAWAVGVGLVLFLGWLIKRGHIPI